MAVVFRDSRVKRVRQRDEDLAPSLEGEKEKIIHEVTCAFEAAAKRPAKGNLACILASRGTGIKKWTTLYRGPLTFLAHTHPGVDLSVNDVIP